ncbi:MAG: 2-isopropylmalate synthase, partial [Acetobacter sp.]|nr:2-isopropylmalate synthase [Acetobacter sp.]
YTTNIHTQKLLNVSRMLATITSFDVQPNKASVGRNAFAHESGIHQDGIMKNAATYEIMTPESVGWSRSSLVMGKHSGRAAFREKLNALGYDTIDETRFNDAFTRFKDLADHKKLIYDEDIIALVDDEVRNHDHIRFVSMCVNTVSGQPSHVQLTLSIDQCAVEVTATGNGPIDAAFNALRQAFAHEAQLLLFSVAAITEGTDAQARTTVRLEESGKLVDGQGTDADTVVSAVRAYVHALNKLLIKRTRKKPKTIREREGNI